MLIFIISVLLTSFICLCFFKKNFWENRYLVLLISGGVALVITLIVNFNIRGKLETKSVIIWKNDLHVFYVNDSLIVTKDSCAKSGVKITPVVKEYDYYNDHKAEEFFRNVYIEKSINDSTAYMTKKKLIYDVKPNNWYSGFSMPRIKTIFVLYLPPIEYATIPDSLIHKAPF